MHRAAKLAIVLLSVAAGVWADAGLEVHDFFQSAANALGDGNSAGFLAAFDSSLPGYGKLKSDVTDLVRASDVRSTIEWLKNEGGDQERTVQLNWQLEVDQRGGASAVTQRHAAVQCRLTKKGGEWRIVSFTPIDLFAPPQVDEAWTVLVNAALGLSASSTGSSNDSADIPRDTARKFMQACDPAMPGYARLQSDLTGLEEGGGIASSIDLETNEGDDRRRTIVVDWSVNLLAPETGMETVHREATVTCTLEKQGRTWRITSMEPRTLFAPRAY